MARRTKAAAAAAAMEDPSDDSQELDKLLKEIAAKKGVGVVTRGDKLPPSNHIPTGAFLLDLALMGGIPEGKNTMLYGMESSGKSLIWYKAIGNYQKKYPKRHVALLDLESMYDPDWASANGIDTKRLQVVSPETGEEAVDLFAAFMEIITVGLVVGDSLPSFVPMDTLEKSAEDKNMAALARLLGILCSKILMGWNKERRRGHEVTVGTINQWRSKVGLVFGDPRTLPGGRQINHLPTTKVEVKKNEVMGKDRYDNEVPAYNEITFKVEKAKHGSSIRSGMIRLNLNPDNEDGLAVGEWDEAKSVCAFAEKFGLISGAGANYRLDLFGWSKMKKTAIKTALLADRPKMDELKATMIMMQRVSKGMPPLPPDKYLVGPGVTVSPAMIAMAVREMSPGVARPSTPRPVADDEDD